MHVQSGRPVELLFHKDTLKLKTNPTLRQTHRKVSCKDISDAYTSLPLLTCQWNAQYATHAFTRNRNTELVVSLVVKFYFTQEILPCQHFESFNNLLKPYIKFTGRIKKSPFILKTSSITCSRVPKQPFCTLLMLSFINHRLIILSLLFSRFKLNFMCLKVNYFF